MEFVGVDSANEFGESPSSWDGIGFIDVSLYQIVNRSCEEYEYLSSRLIY